MSTDLAKLVVSLEAETAKYHKELEKAQKRLESFGKGAQAEATAIGVAVGEFINEAAGRIFEFAKHTIDAADELSKLSQSSGIAVTALSELQYAADLSGVSQEDLAASLSKLNKAGVEAAEGSKEQAAAFKALGVDVLDGSKRVKDSEALLMDVADAFSGFQDGPEKAAVAMAIFGKSGAKLIPFLNSGRVGLEELRAEASKFGVTMTDEAAKAAEEFNDNLTRMQRAAQGVVVQMVQELVPTLTAVSEGMVGMAKDSGTAEATLGAFRVAFETITVLGANVAYVISGIGKELGGLAAQAAAVATLDFSGAARIGEMMKEDAAAARKEIDAFSERVLNAHANAEKVRATMARWKDAIDSSSKSKDLEIQRKTMLGLADAYQAGEFGAVGTTEATKAYEAAVAKALPAIEKKRLALQAVAGQAGKTKSALDSMMESLKLQAATLGMSAEDAELYKLKLAGASGAQLDLAKALLDGKAAFDTQKDALAQGKSVAESVQTPFKAYNAELTKLDGLLKRNAIDQDTFNRAVMAAQNTLVANDPAMQKAIEQNRHLQELLSNTASGQAEKQSADLQLLVDDYLRQRDAIDGNAEATKKYGEAFQNAVGGMPKDTKETTDLMSELTAEAARNMQGALAQFLFEPFKGGMKGMLDSFVTTLEKMVAEAAAAQIMRALVGKTAGGTGDGILGAALNAGIQYFTGTQAPAPVSEATVTPVGARASGGDMRAGQPYLVGEEGPELVFPGTTSRILSNPDSEQWARGGSRVVNQTINIQAQDPNAFRASERQIARKQRQELTK